MAANMFFWLFLWFSNCQPTTTLTGIGCNDAPGGSGYLFVDGFCYGYHKSRCSVLTVDR